MNSRIVLPLSVAAMLFAAQGADASTYLGSADATADPDAYICAACPASTTYGFRQFALRQATVEAPESGVLVSASFNAKRITGTEDPRIAILRPDDNGVSLRVVDSAPIALTGDFTRVDDLHLPMERGDSVGFMFRTGEVDLGVKLRPKPDGAIQSFTAPCDPCGMDGGTGTELLMDAVLEPDVDDDGMGDESQDVDGGGLGMDWEEDWFEDWDAGDQLDEELQGEEARSAAPRAPRAGADRRRAAAQRPRDALAARPEGRPRERVGHAPVEPPHRRRPVHDDPHRQHARPPRGPRSAPARADPGR